MKALVTGGGGFLGKAIVKSLVESGASVRSFSRGDYPELRKLGVELAHGDVADTEQTCSAARDCDIVFHVAAKPGIWGKYTDFYRTNFIGTKNVIDACRRHGIGRLVYCSSASVVFDGRDMEGVDESVPYPAHYEAHYPKTKAMAERLVLESNDADLRTVALRPHLIWGPEDNHLIPRILQRARKLRVVGDGLNRVDTVYIDNAAQAHLLAAQRLLVRPCVSGKAYFITQDEPMPLWEIVNRILSAGNLPELTKRISTRSALAAGAILEGIYGLLRLPGEPQMTRFLARELSTSHWFNIAAAKRDLGYEPAVSFEAGMMRLQDWLRR